jgi:hypothetical protein
MGGSDLPTPRINALLIYVEKDSYTAIEIVGFDYSNNITLNDYYKSDFTNSLDFIKDALTTRPDSRVFKVFEDEEYINEISGLASDIINKLTFKTNKGNEVSINYGLGTKEMHANLRNYGVVSFFGFRNVTGNAFAKLGFWIVRIDKKQPVCENYE